MVHTFEIYIIISKSRARRILNYQGVSRKQDRYSGAVKVNGIANMTVYPVGKPEDGYSILKVIVNPAKLLYGYDAFETIGATPEILNQMSTAFIEAMEEASGETFLPSMKNWVVRRIDYAVDIHLEYPYQYPHQYISLLKKGDKPKSYRDKAKGKTGSCYWGCASTTGNIYYKAAQMIQEGKSHELAEKARNILRFEVQCKSPKVGYLRKKKDLESRELHHLFCREIAEGVLLSYCRRVYKTGDYYSYHAAEAHMKRLGAAKRRLRACQNVLSAIAQTRSISEARKQLTEAGLIVKNSKPPMELRYSVAQFRRNCKKISDMNINPVTIPREWKINYLPSVYGMIESMLMANYNSNGTVIA